ncbi:A disintegrin and metalloproteinase with thrombospondin motifs 5-like [Acipenser oxyrinchus oxyrinchus]|uniref:A disintegrin and metalloproteinase with thrombospondin motifs 5-like n=1 Tax=Acipenser oxyrinchus oxyrinchus TaxID=40147 RepID=A0AAD8DDI1_ACIOX|nr:A disintegrin and metalloproteinase with thrombospondin motifs 5-like [Acipenser oxyrinchus oxyrinchus]
MQYIYFMFLAKDKNMVLLKLFLLCTLELHLGTSLPNTNLTPGTDLPPAASRLLTPRRTHYPMSKNGIVQNIDQIYSGDGKIGYILYADGKKFLLDMERDESILSHHFSTKYVGALQGDAHLGALHKECFYRGTVDSNPESLALFNLCGGLEGFFAVKHARYTIKPLIRAKGRENEVYGAEGDLDRSLHYYTRERFRFEAVPMRESCGTPGGKGKRQSVLAKITGPFKKDSQERWWWGSREANSASGRRTRRSVSRVRHVELLLVADESMSKKYGKDLQHYLLTLASIASRLYGHASIENPIQLAVVKVVVVTDKEKGLEISKNAASTLKSFCKWQNQQNQLDDDHKEHYDAAILFTRQDLCGHHSCDTLGMADLGTICSPERSCAVIEDDGLHAAFTVAHEIGHLLGLSHDDSKYCEENFGTMEDKRLMSSILTSINASKPWSKCTSSTMTDFFDDGHGECLLDPPRRPLLGPEELPGQSYDAIRQCKLAFGPEYTVCPGMDVCARLWCAVIRQGQMVCLTKKLPSVEGTPCGKGRICLHGKCVDKTRKKYYSASNHGSWSSWGSWGQCSRTCGGGVQFARRQCNNPAPRNNGRYCTGKRAIYRSCNEGPCPTNSKRFRLEQCEARNGYQTDPKGVKTFVEWVPKYAGVLPGDTCKLTCRAKGTGYYVVFSQKVIDGTECRPYSNSVCVRGKCVRTGCDGIIGSKLHFDKCGICGGDNSGCIKVVGNFTKKSKGYTDVVTIPEGSTHIKIRQFKPKDQPRYTAYLALRKKSGDYLVNGKFMISTSESIIDLNGTIMNYSGWSQRDDFLHSMGPGSLREVIIVQILATDARQALDVRYSFFMPKKLAPPASTTPQGKGQKAPAPPQTPQWVTGPWLACSRTCDTGWQTRTVQCQDRPNKLAKGCQLKQRPSAFKQCLLKKC